MKESSSQKEKHICTGKKGHISANVQSVHLYAVKIFTGIDSSEGQSQLQQESLIFNTCDDPN